MTSGFGQMARWVRALVALAESYVSTQHLHASSQSSIIPVPGYLMPLLISSVTRHTHGAYTHKTDKRPHASSK